jgi:uncharacterized protein (DUF2345 family)
MAMNCIGTQNGGEITCSGNNVITSVAGEVTNPAGLTQGMGFNVDEQGASVLFDGTLLTLENTVGDIDIISSKGQVVVAAETNVNITATTADVSIQAAQDILLTDGF